MPKKLLIADDSVTVQRVVELTFADEGIEVISVGDGARAIERIEQGAPDIVLADVSMPALDGYQVAEYIKNAPHLCHIPVVLMTGAFEPLDERRARASKCDAALAKPFEPQMVISLVTRLLRGETGNAGLLLGATAPAQPSRVPEEFPAGPSQSLDDYLERLDDALTAASGPVAARAAAARVVPEASAGTEAASLVAGPDTPPSMAATAAAETPSLADAFSALLAAELGEAPLPDGWSAPNRAVARQKPAAGEWPQPAITEAFIEEVARRVARHLTDHVLRQTVNDRVLEIAERLVLEEIERIKASAR